MKPRDRDIAVCIRILKELDDVNDFLKGRSEAEFMASPLLQKATVMSILNIGELTKAFSDDLLDATPWMPWQDIRSTRNIAAHTYDALDMDDVWETYRADLPQMRVEIEKILNRLRNGWDTAKEARRLASKGK